MSIEHITLQPHPLDAWRRALDALIACAPGDATAIAWHLVDASSQLQANRGAIEQMLEQQASADRDAFGFTRRAWRIGTDFSAAGMHEHRQVAQPGAASSAAHMAAEAPLSNECQAASVPVHQGQAAPAFPAQQRDKATLEPGHESAPRFAAGGFLDRPSGDSSCQ